MNGSTGKLLEPERIKGIVLANHKKRNFISIHEMVLFAFKYIFWPIHQQKNKEIIFFLFFVWDIWFLQYPASRDFFLVWNGF